MKKITMISMILICCITSISSGAVILEEDFETGTDGQSFPDWDWPSEQVITGSGIDGKSLSIYRSNPSLGNWGIRSPGFTPTYGLIEFDLLIDTPSVYTSNSSGTDPEGIGFLSGGDIIVGTPAGEQWTSATWTPDQAFRLGILSLADELFVYINDVEIAHIERDSQFSDLPVDFFYFTYGADTVSPGTIMIDNVLVTPEPATLLLFGLGGILLRRKRRAS